MRLFEPAELRGDRITLRPLRLEHAEGLLAAADDDEVFRWLPFPRFIEAQQVRAWIENSLDERKGDRRIPFVIEENADRTLVGSTSYRDLDPDNAHVEIASTWLSRASWGTEVNTESKFLLMQYAFESLNLERVLLRADDLNMRARRAHEKLGAVKEGVHRHEILRRDGSWCNSIYYSVLRSEWRDVKSRLRSRLHIES